MTKNVHHFLAFDVGEKRIGVAQADSEVRMPFTVGTISVDSLEMSRVRELLAEVRPSIVVIGLPRNQRGETTAQTAVSQAFGDKVAALGVEVIYQDESLTSVLAERYLKSQKKPYTKEDIDAHAALIILSDYLEATYG